MHFKALRSYLFLPFLLAAVTRMSAQPCADTQPSIAGSHVVSNNQPGVIYSTPSIPGHTYTWTVTGGSITSGQNTSQITVLWGAIGMGSVSVTETNPAAGCFSTDIKAVSIRPLLVSYFYYTNTSCYGDMLSFFDASVADITNPIVSWFWDFGDLTTSTLQNPTHQYLPPYNTTWTVTLIVTNQQGQTDTIYDAVYVNPNQFIPVAAFSFNNPPCAYQPVTFDASTSTTPPLTGVINHYDWTFGDPASGSNDTVSGPLAKIVNHTFSGPGTYNVQLIVTNERYCKDTITQLVTIQASVPTSNWQYSAPTCQNNPVFFTDLSFFPPGYDIVTWTWNFGDGSGMVVINAPNSPNVSHTFPGLGPYNVSLMVTNNVGCMDTLYRSISLVPSPIANFEWDINCALDTVHFTNMSSLNMGPPIVTFNWDFGDPASGNNTSTLPNPGHVYANPGIYNIRLAIANSTGCPDTIIKTITIYPKPAVEYTWNVGTQNNEIQFHVDSTITNLGAIGYMMSWNFGDGTYGVGHNPTHVYLGAGSFDCILTVTDTNGCSNSVTHTVIVPSMPVAFYSSDGPVCLGQQMCFIDLSSVPTPPFGWIEQWVWNWGDGTPDDTIYFPNNPNACHTFTSVGTYLVTLTVWDNWGFYDSYSHNQDVLPVPIANFFSTNSCADQITCFTDASFPNGGGNIISWDWNFGDPVSGSNNTSNLQNPCHIFSDSGTYNVRLIIINFNNCTDTVIKPVYVFPHPPVDFTHDTACATHVVTFSTDTLITHIDSIATWSWDFGDGTPFGTDPVNTAHMYPLPGLYTVTLTVVDIHGCINTVSHQVRVNPLPIPEFTWSTPACEGGPVQFTDQSYVPTGYLGFIAKWVWDFGDGTTQTIILPGNPNVLHTFVGPGLNHVVRLTVYTSDSCFEFIEHTINSTPAPTANYGYSAIHCEGQVIQFTDLTQTNGGGAIGSWDWNFDDPGSGVNDISTLQNPVHIFATWGTYNVRLIVHNVTGCVDTVIQAVTINRLPMADFAFDTACFNSPTNFTDLSVPYAATIITYDWNFGDGTPHSPMQSPNHTYLTYGYFNVTLTITNSNGCTHDTTKQILVNPLPVPEFSFSTPSCVGECVQYNDLSSTIPGYLGSIVKWVWDFGDGTFNTILFPANPNICHVFAGPALSHTVRLTITTSDSCTAFIEHVVTSIPSPTANYSYSSSSCADQAVQFSDLSQTNGGGNIITWQWNFGDPASGVNNVSNAQNPIHVFTSAGAFNVVLIVVNTSNCTDTITQVVNVNMLPVANFTADSACLGTATNFTDISIPNAANIISWDWNFGDGSLHSATQNPTHIYGNYGYFQVTLTITNSNGCVKDTTMQIYVKPKPNAEFSFSTPSCVGAVVQYTDLSSTVPGFLGTIVKWTWDFDDGTQTVVLFPGNPNVTHTFVGPALSHNVTLTIQVSDSCIATVQHVVNSIPSPAASFTYTGSSCVGSVVQFTDLSQTNGGGNIISWFWNFGDPPSGTNNTSNAQNPMHQFTTPGIDTVMLIVTNTSNCTDTMWMAVTVDSLAQAEFSADTACLGTATQFTDLSIPHAAGISSWSWDFGDGLTSGQPNPSHTYGNYGLFNVTLTIINTNGCANSITHQIMVRPNPIAQFNYSTPNCLGAVVNYTNLSTTVAGYPGTIVTWLWDFGDGTTLTINFPGNPNVTHTFVGNSTTHIVRLTVTTSDGCSSFIEHTVVSIPEPIAAFSYPPSTCEGMAIQFTDLSQTNGGGNLISWLWNFGDPASGTNNISISQNPIHTFTGPGSFIVSLIVQNNSGCTDTIVDTLTMNAVPVANFHADTACLGSLTHFTDMSSSTPGTIAAHFWDFGDGQTSTAANPTHLFGASGVHQVTLTVTSSLGCVKSITKGVLVLPAPVAAFSAASPACASDSVQFTDQSVTPHGTIIQWVWDFNDGSPQVTINYPSSPNIMHFFTLGGTYNVVLTITTSDNCTATITQPVAIESAPLANYSYGTTRCEHMPVQFTDLSQPNGGTPIAGWLWNFDDPGSGSTNASTLQNPVHVFSTNGQFQVKLTIMNANGCSDTVTKPVDVNQGPVAMFTSDTSCLNMPTSFSDASTTPSGTIIAWLWNFDDPGSGTNNTSTLQNPTHTFTMTGSFNVTLTVTNSNSCTNDTVMPITVNPKPNAFFSADAACVSSPTQFTDLSTAPGSSIVAWFWDFGDGTGTSTDQDPVYVYTASGTYNVKLRVTNLSNCQDSIIIPVVARPTPIAAYSYINFFCPAGQVNFQDESQGVGAAITEHLWIFEPGSTSDAPNPTHTFSITDSTYAVTLIVTDNYGCKDTIIDSVYVKPGMAFTFTNDTVCYLDGTHFHVVDLAQGDSLYSPFWDFGDPASGPQNYSFLYNPVHNYTAPGTYIVKLRVTNSDNCTDSTYLSVPVYTLPQPVFDFVSTPCDSIIRFHDLSLSGSGTIASWEWTFGDGSAPLTINAPGPGDTSHLYTTIGTYQVILKITNTNGCVDTVMQTVELYPCIMATFGHDSLLCARSPIGFTDGSLPISRITQWHWFFGDGQDTTYGAHIPVIHHTYADAGVYNVDLVINAIVSGVAFTDTARQVLIIHPTPQTAFSNAPVCWKQVTIFKDTSNTFGEPINSWTWTFGESKPGDTSYVKNPTHQYDSAGFYLVRLITVNRFGCIDSLTKTTRVHNLPVADFAHDLACTDNPTDFQDMTEIADTALQAWMWNFGDVNTNNDTSLYQNPNYVYKSDGQYNVRMIVQDMAGCRDTVDSLITVHVSPISSFTFVENIDGMTGKLELDNHTTGADTYFWDFGNGQNSTDENPIVSYSEDGTYLIMLISSNSFQCMDTTFMKYEVLFKGLYIPNAFAPSSTNLAVRNFKPVGVNLKTFHIEVFDTWGHLVWSSSALDSQGRPTGEWNGNFDGGSSTDPCPIGTYMWKATATFIDDTIWEGSDIGKGSTTTMGSVSLIR